MSFSITPETEETAEQRADTAKLDMLMKARIERQNLSLALVAGLAASLAAAVAWAAVTYATSYQIGFMAVGVGFLVGYAVKYAGKGVTATFGIVGAALEHGFHPDDVRWS